MPHTARRAGKLALAQDLLRRCPDLTDFQIAAAARCHPGTVAKARELVRAENSARLAADPALLVSPRSIRHLATVPACERRLFAPHVLEHARRLGVIP